MFMKTGRKDHRKEKDQLKLKKLSLSEEELPKNLKTYKEEDIMDVINKCNSLNFCLARTMSSMPLAQKHCPMMSFYLDSQRDNDDELDLCIQDLLHIVQSKKRKSLADPSQIVPGLMLASALFIESEKHATEAAKMIQTFEVPLAEPVPSIMKTREHIHRYRVGGIVLKEEDFSTLDSQNWVNDKVNMNIVHFLSKLKIRSAIKCKVRVPSFNSVYNTLYKKLQN